MGIVHDRQVYIKESINSLVLKWSLYVCFTVFIFFPSQEPVMDFREPQF